MGTRADFYLGKGKKAKWLGSIAWDGYRDGIPDQILLSRDPSKYRAALTTFLKARKDATFANLGWPWPWNDSGTTDCSYWFFDGRCWTAYPSDDGDRYVPCDEPEPKWGHRGADENRQLKRWMKGRERVEYPDMAAQKNVTLGERSGVMVFSSR